MAHNDHAPYLGAANGIATLDSGTKVPAVQLPVLVGDSGSGGVAGAVPAPMAGDAAAGKYLKADGSWAAIPDGSVTTANVVWVSKGGNDGTGTRNRLDRPFLTIGAAITAALAGDVVVIMPGVYTEAVVCKDDVSVTSWNRFTVTIKQTTPGVIIVTMANRMSLSHVTLLAQSAGAITGIKFDGTSAATSNLFRVFMDPTSTGNVTAVQAVGSGTTPVGRATANACQLIGFGTGYGIDSSGTALIRLLDCIVSGAVGANISGAGVLYVTGGELIGTTNALACSASGTFAIDPNVSVQGSISNLGTIIRDGDSFPASNWTAIVDPTVSNDQTAGYDKGSRWLNTVTNTFFICLSGATGAAVWKQTNNFVAAGGDLSGNYPNPTVAQSSVAFALNSTISPTTLAANTNDYAPTGLATANTIRISSTLAVNLTGLTGGAAGRILAVYNVGSFAITLVSESGASTAANRFGISRDMILQPNAGVTLEYDSTASRWRMIGSARDSVVGGDLTGTMPNPTVKQASTEFALTADITPTTIATSQNDYSPAGLSAASCLRLSSSASVNLTGIAGGTDGRILTIYNVGANLITLLNESLSSVSANRFSIAANITLNPNGAVILQYDVTSSRWRVLGVNPSGLPVQTFSQASFFQASASYIEVTNASWTAVGNIFYPGISQFTPDTAKAILSGSSVGTIDVRIYDLTNGLTVCEQLNLAVTASPLIYNLGAVSNLVVGEAVWEFQMQKSGAPKPRAHAVSLYQA